MKTLSIQQKVYGAIALLSLLVVIAGAVIDHYSTKIAEDSAIMDALGRQSMLTQAMGKAGLLNVSSNEYETAKNIFTQTLQAAKVGGQYPADLKMTKLASMKAIDDSEIQKTILHLEVELKNFVKLVQDLVNKEINSEPYRKVQENINSESNNLRTLSNELVQYYKNNIYLSNQAKLNWANTGSGILALIIQIGIALFLTRVVIRPIQQTSAVLSHTANGDLRQERLPVTSNDEVGVLSQSCNTLVEGLQNFIKYSEDILAGKNSRSEFGLKGEFESSLERMLHQAEEKKNSEERERKHAVELQEKERQEAHEVQERQEKERKVAQELQDKVDNMLKVVKSAADGDLTQEISVNGTAMPLVKWDRALKPFWRTSEKIFL